VSVKVPVGVAAPAVTRSVVEAELLDGGVSELVSNVQVAAEGQPLTLRPTALLNVFREVTLIVDVPSAPPCVTVIEVGFADIEKSGITTFSVTVVL
jgi:hypothetical protein